MLWRFLASLAAHFGVFMPCVEGATISLAHQTERTGFPASLELFSGTGAGVALGEINANPSVLPGHILTIGTTVDGGCTKRQGVGGALDMVINQTWAPIAMGPLCSASVEGSNHVFSAHRIIQLSPLAVGGYLLDQETYPNLLGLRSLKEEYGFAAILKSFGYSRIGIVQYLTTNVQDSVVNAQDSVVDTLPSTFKQMTGSDLRVVSHYKMQAATAQEAENAVIAMRDGDTRVIINFLQGPDAILYYCAAYRLGYFGDHLLYLTPMWNSRSWATLYPTEGCTPEIVGKGVGNSLSVISPFLRETDDAGTVLEGQRTPSAIWNEIWGPLQAGCAPLGLCDLIDPRDAWSIAGTFYDAVWLSALGLHSYLNDGQAALDGITADDLNTANVTKQSQIYSGLYRALINQDFKGVSGRVRFDSSANRVADMTVGYFDTELAVVDVGRIFIETGEIEWATPLSWTDGSTWHPPSGQFAKVAQALAICPAGYQRNEQDGCVPCEAGYFSPEEGSSCMWCPVGAISEGPASAVCKNCSEGWYAPSTGMSACRACPVGYFRNSSQSAGQCERCPLGTFNSATGSVQCSVCKDTKTTAGYASIVETDCTCKEGSFLNKVTDTCESCLEAMRCEGGDGIPDVKPGYWATAESTENFTGPSVVLHCYRNEEVCKGGPMARETKEDTTTPSRRLFSLTESVDPNCEAPRFGPMCDFCPLGTFKSGKTCAECFAGFGGFPLFALLLAVIALVILCYFTVNHKEDARSHATTQVTVTFSILLNFVQQLAAVQKIQFRTTGIVHFVLSRFAYLDFDMEGIRRECFLPGASGFQIYMFTALLPLLPLCASALCYGVSQLLNRYIWSKIPPWDLNKTINTAGFFLSTIYVSICTLTLAPFLCIPHPKGHTTLELFPSVTCGSEEHSRMEILGAVAIVVYIFGFLSFLAIVSLGAPKWDQTHAGFGTRYNFMIGDCHPKVWWWPVMNLTKNLLIAAVPLMETDNGGIQIVLMMLVFHVFLVLHVCCWPWRDSVNNWVDLSATVVFLCLLTGMMAWTDHTAASNSVFTVMLPVLIGGQLCVSMAVIGIGLFRCSPGARRRERGTREDLKARLLSTVQKLNRQTDEAWASATADRNWLITLLSCPDSDIESIDRFLEICEAEFLDAPGDGQAPSPMNGRKRGTQAQAYFGVVADTFGVSSRKHVSGRRLKVSVAAAAKSVGASPTEYGERGKTGDGGVASLREEGEEGEADEGQELGDDEEIEDDDFEIASERTDREERGEGAERGGRFHLRRREGEGTGDDSVELGSPVAIRSRGPQESSILSIKSEELDNLDIAEEEEEEEDEWCVDMNSPLRGDRAAASSSSSSPKRVDGFFPSRYR